MFTKKRLIGVLTSAVLLAAMISAPAHAVNLTITAGTVDFDGSAPAISDFSGVTLNGTPQLTSLSIDPFTVIDATGSGAGWNVLLTTPNLSTGGGSPHVIAATNITMNPPVITGAVASDTTGVTGWAGGPFATGGNKIVDAAATDGMGTYLVAPQILKLTIPITTIAGAYTSAMTIAVVSGP